MSTIFNVRNLKMPSMSRAPVIVGTLVVVLALTAAVVGWQLYEKLTTNTVVAYFTDTLALYPGDKVEIMGVRVGTIDKIDPAGDKMKVTFYLREQARGPSQRYRVDPEPEPSGVAHHPVGAALYRRPGAGGWRRHPA